MVRQPLAVLLLLVVSQFGLAQRSVLKQEQVAACSLYTKVLEGRYSILPITPRTLQYDLRSTVDGKQVLNLNTGNKGTEIDIVLFRNNPDQNLPPIIERIVLRVGEPDPGPNPPPPNPDPTPVPKLEGLAKTVYTGGISSGISKSLAKQFQGNYEGIVSKIAAVSTYTGPQAIEELNDINNSTPNLPAKFRQTAITVGKELSKRGKKNGSWNRDLLIKPLTEIADGFKALAER